MMQARAAAMVMAQVDEDKRPKILALLGMITGLWPLVGPVIGGFILSFMHSACIFWINIPLCFIILLACRKLHFNETLYKPPYNLLSLLLYGLFMGCLLFGLSLLTSDFSKKICALLFLLAFIFMLLLIQRESAVAYPIINRALLKKEISFSLCKAR